MAPESESSAVTAPKRPRSSKNVCVVLHCWSGNSKSDEYKFYIVDLESFSGGGDEFPYTKPSIRFKAKSPLVAFCALNSTLYMFEGVDPFRVPQKEEKWAWKFKMSPEILGGFDYKLQRNKNLDKIKPMHYNKFYPRALPTPDGKRILVFSSQVFREQGANRSRYCGDRIELYDVDQESWVSSLPLPPHGNVLFSEYTISAYGFVNESHFVIQTDFGAFGLNLQTMDWDEKQLVHCGIPRYHGHFLGIGGFYFTPSYAYDVIDRDEHEFPSLSSFPQDHNANPHECYFERYLTPYITLLSHNSKDGFCDMGVVQAKNYPYSSIKTENLLVILDIYRTDTKKFIKDVEIYKIERAAADIDEHEGEEDFMEEDTEEEDSDGEDSDGGEFEEEELEEQVPEPKPPLPNTFKPLLPLLNSTTIIKRLKLQTDFDFFAHVSGSIYVFPI